MTVGTESATVVRLFQHPEDIEYVQLLPEFSGGAAGVAAETAGRNCDLASLLVLTREGSAKPNGYYFRIKTEATPPEMVRRVVAHIPMSKRRRRSSWTRRGVSVLPST